MFQSKQSARAAPTSAWLLIVLVVISSCSAQQFRSFPANPDTPLRRLAPAAYEDGISAPRATMTKGNGSLPNPRAISNGVSKQSRSSVEPSGLNSLFWSWAQFVDHDIALIPEGEDEQLDITVPDGDSTFGSVISSIPFQRSIFTEGRPRKPREQKNSITPLIDASMIYGSTERIARRLRESEGSSPFLEVGIQGYPRVLGINFIAGDIRAAEQPGLGALQGLFVREHNRLVRRLIDEVGMTNNNTIYQTARLIVANEIQKITFAEYLPKILGRTAAMQQRYKFRASAKPFIFNEFTTACYRYGHTMVSETLSVADSDFCAIPSREITLQESFFNPRLSLDLGMDKIIRGLLIVRAEKVDVKVVDSLRDFLFQPRRRPTPFGLDLASINIQRGRDHGLGNYCAVRRALNLKTNVTYTQITGGNKQLSRALQQLYGPDPCEMDLWVAGLAEKKVPNAILGKTCQAVIRRQFDNLFRADKFHISNMDYSGYGLEKDPILDSSSGLRLGSVTLGDIIALNTAVRTSQKDIFKTKTEPASCRR